MAMDPSSEHFKPPVGTLLGDYELLQLLGEGVFGVVYLARRGSDDSLVALKLLRGPLGHDPQVFEEERGGLQKACKAPPEARVVRLVDAWEEAALGHCYCLTTAPYCSGGSLETLISTRVVPMALRTRLRWALEVAETLELLHSEPGVRLYHGDVTPRNVALYRATASSAAAAGVASAGEIDWEGGVLEAYLLDLGVSMHNHPHGMTEPLKGYSTSVAPEMEEGSRAFDQSADVWSLGVLLYVLLSWSLDRMGGQPERAWFSSLPAQARAAWVQELRGAEEELEEERWEAVVSLMVDCVRVREERVGMEAVVHVLRRALGYHGPPTRLVWLEERLRHGRAAGRMAAEEEAALLGRKAAEHRVLQQQEGARICLERAVRLCRSCYEESGVPSRFLGPALGNLAALYASKGDYKSAEPLFKEALGAIKAALPPVYPDIAQACNNLAALYEVKGEIDRALQLHEEALALYYKAALPAHHPLILRSLNSLAGLYQTMGEYEKALPLLKETLAIRRALLPPNHPDIAISINNLAIVYKIQGDRDSALSLFKEALDMRRATLPADHPDIADSLNNLAKVYWSKGDYDGALPLLKEALAMYKAALPANHPHIASSLSNLGAVYWSKGDYDTALPLLEDALSIDRAVLPASHPQIIRDIEILAGLYESKGEHDQAQPLHEELLALGRRAS